MKTGLFPGTLSWHRFSIPNWVWKRLKALKISKGSGAGTHVSDKN